MGNLPSQPDQLTQESDTVSVKQHSTNHTNHRQSSLSQTTNSGSLSDGHHVADVKQKQPLTMADYSSYPPSWQDRKPPGANSTVILDDHPSKLSKETKIGQTTSPTTPTSPSPPEPIIGNDHLLAGVESPAVPGVQPKAHPNSNTHATAVTDLITCQEPEQSSDEFSWKTQPSLEPSNIFKSGDDHKMMFNPLSNILPPATVAIPAAANTMLKPPSRSYIHVTAPTKPNTGRIPSRSSDDSSSVDSLSSVDSSDVSSSDDSYSHGVVEIIEIVQPPSKPPELTDSKQEPTSDEDLSPSQGTASNQTNQFEYCPPSFSKPKVTPDRRSRDNLERNPPQDQLDLSDNEHQELPDTDLVASPGDNSSSSCGSDYDSDYSDSPSQSRLLSQLSKPKKRVKPRQRRRPRRQRRQCSQPASAQQTQASSRVAAASAQPSLPPDVTRQSFGHPELPSEPRSPSERRHVGADYGGRYLEKAFIEISAKWMGKQWAESIVHMHRRLDELRVTCGDNWPVHARSLIFGQMSQHVSAKFPKYISPSPVGLFQCDTALRSNLYVFRDELAVSTLPPTVPYDTEDMVQCADATINGAGQKLQPDASTNSPSGIVMLPIFYPGIGPPCTTIAAKSERRASMIVWVLEKVFHSIFPRTTHGVNVKITQRVAWILGGYCNPRSDRSILCDAPTENRDYIGRSPDAPFPLLPELCRRFLIMLEAYGAARKEGCIRSFSPQMAAAWMTHPSTPKFMTNIDGSPGDDTTIPPAVPYSIHYDSNGTNITGPVCPAPHDLFIKAFGIDGKLLEEAIACKLSGNFLDVWRGQTRPEETRRPFPGEIIIRVIPIRRPRGVTHAFDGTPLPEILGYVLHIENAFSPLFQARVLCEMTRSAEWMSHRLPGNAGQIGSSTKERNYRVVVKDVGNRVGDVFIISNDPVPLLADTSNQLAEEMTFDIVAAINKISDDLIQECLKRLQADPNPTIAAKYKDRHYARWDSNKTMCQSVLNKMQGVYGIHDDGSPHHNHEYNVADGETVQWGSAEANDDGISTVCPQFYTLPHKSVMNVGTCVFAAEGDPDKPGQPSTHLQHYLKTRLAKDEKKYPLGDGISLGPRAFHLQYFLQKFATHGVRSIVNRTNWRVGMSHRMSTGPSDGYVFDFIRRRENLSHKRYSHYKLLPPKVRDECLPPSLEALVRDDIDGCPLNKVSVGRDDQPHDSATAHQTPARGGDTDNDNGDPQAPVGKQPPMIEYCPPKFAGMIRCPTLASHYSSSITRAREPLWYQLTRAEFLEKLVNDHNTAVVLRSKQTREKTKKITTGAGAGNANAEGANDSDSDSDADDDSVDQDWDWHESLYGIPVEMQVYDDPLGDNPKLLPKSRLIPGDVLDDDDVRDVFGNLATDGYRPPWRYGVGKESPAAVNCCINSYRANNELDGLKAMQERLNSSGEEKRATDEDVLAESIDAIIRDTWVGGSGGTGMASGAQAQPLDRTSAVEAPQTAAMHSDQSPDLPQNQIMLRASTRGTVVHYFATWVPPTGTALTNNSQKRFLQFIALFKLNGHNQHPDTRAMLDELMLTPGLDPSELKNLEYRLMNFFKFFLERYSNARSLYFAKDPKILYINEDTSLHTFSCSSAEMYHDTLALAKSFFESDQHLPYTQRALLGNPTVGVDDAEQEEVKENDGTFEMSESLLHIDPESSCQAVSRVCIAGVMRALRLNVDDDNNVHYLKDNEALPSCPSDDLLAPLGVVPRTAPCHLPNRELDPATAFLMMLSENTLGTKVGPTPGSPLESQVFQPRVRLIDPQEFTANPAKLERFLMTSMAIRFTGNIDAIADFISTKGAHANASRNEETGRFDMELFDSGKLREFAEYVYQTTFRGDGYNADVRKIYMTSQYLASLPNYQWNADYCREVITSFSRSARPIAEKLIADLTSIPVEQRRFEDAVSLVRRHVDNVLKTMEERIHCRFPCFQVMADLDFIVEGKPFGDTTFAVWLYKGYGSDQGLSVFLRDSNYMEESGYGHGASSSVDYCDVVLKDVCGDPVGLDQTRQNLMAEANYTKCKLPNFLFDLEKYLENIEDNLTDDQLTLRGWKRVTVTESVLQLHEGDGDETREPTASPHQPPATSVKRKAPCTLRVTKTVIVSRYNGKPISAVNMEHEFCVVYYICSRAKGTRAHNAPAPYRDYCHPSPTDGLFSTATRDVYQAILNKYLSLCHDPGILLETLGQLQIAFRVFGEEADWTIEEPADETV